MKILIAEDDLIAQKVLGVTLERAGYEVVTVADGRAAWEAFDQKPTRIIVSDWMMPDMDGLELCRKVRDRPNTEYTYFILLTAINNDRERVRDAMSAGIDDFLTKPLDREIIRMRLRVAERILGYATQIKQLKELIPICQYCKKIRDDGDYWAQLEQYISRHTGANFSHGICPECLDEQVGLLANADD